MSALADFLLRNTVTTKPSLPLVHTSRAHHLRSFLEQKIIKTSSCDVFTTEDLNYLFVGRPAYKFDLTPNAEEWELPICLIMDFDFQVNRKRVFPFDSGGFNRLPNFISTLDRDSFEISSDTQADKKIIGTFLVIAQITLD